MKIKHLTEHNIEGFFSKLIPGECFTYSDYFFPKEIMKLALESGIEVSYCPPGTVEYKNHGSQTMRVNHPVPKGAYNELGETAIRNVMKLMSNAEYYRKRCDTLEMQIEAMKQSSAWKNPDLIQLDKPEYTREEIAKAFLNAKIYEGLVTNEFGTVLDTFIDFLEGRKKSHSV